jgi:uncharacterized protein YndB with AHSA1/START domain
MEVQMPYTYTLTSVIPATPQEIYDAWLDSVAHSEMTGGEATMSGEVGAEVSAWAGYITGRNLELVPGERIVQSWRTSEFGEEHEDSIVTVMLEGTDEGTLLTLVHSNVPEEHRSYEEGGWESNYFEPMRLYFASLEEEEAGEEPQPAAPEPAPKPAPKRAPKRAAKAAAKAAAKPRRAAGRGAKKTAAKVKAAKGRKTKRAAAAKKRRKIAKPAAKKRAKRVASKRKSRRGKPARR